MSTSPISAIILARVSTNSQESTRQLSELRAYAASRGYNVIEEIAETVSGRADDKDRFDLQRVRELAAGGKVKKVLVHEISRIARRNSTVHKFVEDLEKYGVSLYWAAQNIETLDDRGKRNPAASIMMSLLADMARHEVEQLRERIRSGFAEARRKGKQIGHAKGWRMKPEKRLAKHADIVNCLRAGRSIRDTANHCQKPASTVQRIKALMMEHEEATKAVPRRRRATRQPLRPVPEAA